MNLFSGFQTTVGYNDKVTFCLILNKRIIVTYYLAVNTRLYLYFNACSYQFTISICAVRACHVQNKVLINFVETTYFDICQFVIKDTRIVMH